MNQLTPPYVLYLMFCASWSYVYDLSVWIAYDNKACELGELMSLPLSLYNTRGTEGSCDPMSLHQQKRFL